MKRRSMAAYGFLSKDSGSIPSTCPSHARGPDSVYCNLDARSLGRFVWGFLARRGGGKPARFVRTAGDEAEVLAEAEGGDALLEGSAAAAEKALEKSFEAKPTGNAGFDLGELLGGKFFPARADGCVVAKAAEEEFDFRQGETHFSGEANEQDAVESVWGITALAAGAVRRSEEAESFVVADGGGVKACAVGEVADSHNAPLQNWAFGSFIRDATNRREILRLRRPTLRKSEVRGRTVGLLRSE